MLIIGERINTSRTVAGVKEIEDAVLARNAKVIATSARKQAEDGATYIDINAGTLTSGEPEALAWLTGVVSAATDAPICFDQSQPRRADRGAAGVCGHGRATDGEQHQRGSQTLR